MNDKELLVLAAKAEGRTLKYMTQHIAGREPEEFIACWNPLTDDGDALRLAVKLGLDVSHNSFGNVIVDHYTQPESNKVVLPHGVDKYAATRRAIVRAAAAIGEKMP